MNQTFDPSRALVRAESTPLGLCGRPARAKVGPGPLRRGALFALAAIAAVFAGGPASIGQVPPVQRLEVWPSEDPWSRRLHQRLGRDPALLLVTPDPVAGTAGSRAGARAPALAIGTEALGTWSKAVGPRRELLIVAPLGSFEPALAGLANRHRLIAAIDTSVAPAELHRLLEAAGLGTRGLFIGAAPAPGSAGIALEDQGKAGKAWLEPWAMSSDFVVLGEALSPDRGEELLQAARACGLPVLSASPWLARRGATFGLEADVEIAARLVVRALRLGQEMPVAVPVRRVLDVAGARDVAPVRAAIWPLIVDEVQTPGAIPR